MSAVLFLRIRHSYQKDCECTSATLETKIVTCRPETSHRFRPRCPLEAVEEYIYNKGRIDVIAALKVAAALPDLETCRKINVCLQKSASILSRTDLSVLGGLRTFEGLGSQILRNAFLPRFRPATSRAASRSGPSSRTTRSRTRSSSPCRRWCADTETRKKR